MTTAAYYNEIDPYAAAWLRKLIAGGHIAPGDVDERDIRDVRPDDLAGYRQCHFFAGIGGWSHALRLAGWPDDREVWTGSCPCQPFSAAGRGVGFADERHLWPAFQWLIGQCRPAVVFGEQVASSAADAWIDLVQDDLEALGYAVGAVPIPAASVGAPHIRDRMWWVADTHSERHERERLRDRQRQAVPETGGRSEDGRLAHSSSTGLEGRDAREVGHEREAAERGGGVVGVADAADGGRYDRRDQHARRHGGAVLGAAGGGTDCGSGPLHGFWRDADWLHCRDGKWRPVEPGTFPLAHGVSNRVGRLRAYGNAIVPQVAAEFIAAWADAR